MKKVPDEDIKLLKKKIQKEIGVVLINAYNNCGFGSFVENPFLDNAKYKQHITTIQYRPNNKNHSLDQYLCTFNSITDIDFDDDKIFTITFCTIPTLELIIKDIRDIDNIDSWYNRVKTYFNIWEGYFSNEDEAKDNLYKQRGYRL